MAPTGGLVVDLSATGVSVPAKVTVPAGGRVATNAPRDSTVYPALSVMVATVTCGQSTLLKIRITSCEYCSCR